MIFKDLPLGTHAWYYRTVWDTVPTQVTIEGVPTDGCYRLGIGDGVDYSVTTQVYSRKWIAVWFYWLPML